MNPYRSISRRLHALREKLAPDVHAPFKRDHYQRHNQRRLEHLATLGLDLQNKTVLEVGAGIGDHTHFFLDRGCQVYSTDARPENTLYIQRRYPGTEVAVLDLNHPKPVFGGRQFDIVYCYGTLYHLSNPAVALAYLSPLCTGLLLLETCVSRGSEASINPAGEVAKVYTQAMDGTGCRPTRPWIYSNLKSHFQHAYMPRTQPHHHEFPLDWSQAAPAGEKLIRAVFVASRAPLDNPALSEGIPAVQTRA